MGLFLGFLDLFCLVIMLTVADSGVVIVIFSSVELLILSGINEGAFCEFLCLPGPTHPRYSRFRVTLETAQRTTAGAWNRVCMT